MENAKILYLSQIFRYMSPCFFFLTCTPEKAMSHLVHFTVCIAQDNNTEQLLSCYFPNTLILNPMVRKNSTEISQLIYPALSHHREGGRRRGDVLICSCIFNRTMEIPGMLTYDFSFFHLFMGIHAKKHSFAQTPTRRSPVLAEGAFSSVLFFAAASTEGSLVLKHN